MAEAPPLPEMSQATARELYEHGAFFILLDFTEGSEFGIDYHSWATGPKFMGLKMIPPGLHFIYISCSSKRGGRAPRIGFFHEFKEKEVLVRRWDPKIEDFSPEAISSEETERVRAKLKEMDGNLGPYPYQNLKTWFALTNHVSAELALKIQPESGRITTQCELTTLEAEALGGAQSIVNREHPNRLRFVDDQGLPVMSVKEGHQLRFNDIPLQRVPNGASGPEITRHSIDGSHQLRLFVDECYSKEEDILGEVQFAFVCFLVGHVYEGFEQWKRLVALLCSCTDALSSREKLYQQFLMTLFFQLRECPKDFFVDIVTRDNFLNDTLATLFHNLDQNPGVSKELTEKAKKFKQYLKKNFKWGFELAPDNPTVAAVS